MNQLSLILDPPRARRRDPETSHAAAKRAGSFAANHRERIKAALAQGPGNIYEIGARCGLDHVAVARRMPELFAAGVAIPEGKRDGCRIWRLA